MRGVELSLPVLGRLACGRLDWDRAIERYRAFFLSPDFLPDSFWFSFCFFLSISSVAEPISGSTFFGFVTISSVPVFGGTTTTPEFDGAFTEGAGALCLSGFAGAFV